MLVDDHQVFREGLKSVVNSHADMEVVGEAADGLEAARRADELRPDLIIMDISMPRLNGIRSTSLIRKALPQTRVLAVTVHQDKAYVREMLEAGASGYVLKIAAAEELVGAIRRVANGDTYIDPLVAKDVVSGFIRHPEGLAETPLTGRETQVLRLMAQGYSNKETAGLLDISVKTVETYKQRLMDKLNLSGRVDMVRYAARQGWLGDG